MDIDLGLLAGDALFPLVGYALLYALGIAQLRRRDLRLLGLSYISGWALLGCWLSLALMAGLDPGIATALASAALLTAACALWGARARRAPAAAPARGRAGPLALLVAGFGAATIAAASLAALVVACTSEWNPAQDFDAIWFWIPKAETIYYLHGLDASAWGALAHPEYPPLLPTLDALCFDFAGGFHPALLPLQMTLLGVAFLLGALELLARTVPGWIAFPSVALLATSYWFFDGLASPLPDQTVAYLVALAALACLLWLCERERRWLALASLLLGAATLTKLEGGLYAALLALLVLGAGFALARRAARPPLVLLLAPALILPWHLWLERNGLRESSPDYSIGDLLQPHYLAARGARLSDATHYVLSVAYDLLVSATGGQWRLLAFAALLLAAARRVPAGFVVSLAFVLLGGFALITTYWIGRPPIDVYITETIWRVEPTLIIIATVLVPLLVGLALLRAGVPAAGATPGATPDPAPAGRPARRRSYARGFLRAGLALLCVLAALGGFFYLTRAPLASTASASPVDVQALEQELDVTERLALVARGYGYDLDDFCLLAEPDRLVFTCHMMTINTADPSHTLGWNVVVSCRAQAGDRQRCRSNDGEALQ